MYPVSDGVVEGVGSFSEAHGSTPTVKKPSVPGHFWECDRTHLSSSFHRCSMGERSGL